MVGYWGKKREMGEGEKKDSKGRFARTRFLAGVVLSSPILAFVYSPLLVLLTVAGIAVPFATGRFIDSLVGGISPFEPFAMLASLMLVRAILTPCLQRLVLSRARDIELKLQGRVLDAAMDFPPSELGPLSDGTLAGSVSDLYDCLVTAVEMGIPLESAVRAATLNPCRSVGIDDRYGSIAVGKSAHFLLLDRKDLSIKMVI